MLVTYGPVHIDHELITNRAGRIIKTLGVDIIVTTVAILVIGLPGNNKAAIIKGGN